MRNVFMAICCLVTLQSFSQSETIKHETMKKYFLHGKFTAKPGMADELSGILMEASHLVSTAKGCQLYVVSRDPEDAHAVYVTEIWDSKADHDDSLKVEGVRALITKAMPMIAGPPQKGQELEVLGGAGI